MPDQPVSEDPRLDPETLANEFAAVGRDLLRKGLLSEAGEAFQWVLATHPEDAAAWCNLGIAHMLLDRLEAAEQATRRYLALAPDDVAATVRLGMLQRRRGNLEPAADTFRLALKLDPRSAAAWRELGLACLENKRLDEAVDALRKAVERNPQSAESWAGLGKAHERQHQPNLALNTYHEGLKHLEPSRRGPVYARLGRLYRKMGEWIQAEIALNKAVARGTSDPELVLELGYVLFMQDKFDSAGRQVDVLEAMGARELSVRLRDKVTSRKLALCSSASLAAPHLGADPKVSPPGSSSEGLASPAGSPSSAHAGEASTTGGSTRGFLKWFGIRKPAEKEPPSVIDLIRDASKSSSR